MNKLFENLARAVGKALANKWMSDLQKQRGANDPRIIPGSGRANQTTDHRSKNSKESP
jgi:hypothetical protein